MKNGRVLSRKEVFELILKALGLALALIFMIGPVFFSLIQTSIEKTFKAGFLMAIGIIACDSLYVLLCYLGLVKFLRPYAEYSGIIGGGILIIFGIYSILKVRSRIDLSTRSAIESDKQWKYILKGFLVNFANPFVVIFWIATVSGVSAQYSTSTEILLFFSLVISLVFVGDVTKVLLANKLKSLITVRFIKIMNLFVGLILTGVGVRLLFVSPESLQF